MTVSTALLVGLAVVLVVVGVVGIVVPGIPGVALIFAGGWCAAAAGDYVRIGVGTLVVLGALAGIGIVVDWVAQSLGVSRVGASRMAVLGSVIGTLAGVFSGLWGLIFFPFLGAVAGEVLTSRDIVRAGKVGVATWIGMVFGAALKIAIAFSMIAIIVVASLA